MLVLIPLLIVLCVHSFDWLIYFMRKIVNRNQFYLLILYLSNLFRNKRFILLCENTHCVALKGFIVQACLGFANMGPQSIHCCCVS